MLRDLEIIEKYMHKVNSFFFGYTAGCCIIDNTNLARLRGTGKWKESMVLYRLPGQRQEDIEPLKILRL